MTLTATTPARTKLIEDAKLNGFTVEVESSGFFRIYKPGGRYGKKYGVFTYDEKTVHEMNANFLTARPMKSFKEIRKALGL